MGERCRVWVGGNEKGGGESLHATYPISHLRVVVPPFLLNSFAICFFSFPCVGSRRALPPPLPKQNPGLSITRLGPGGGERRQTRDIARHPKRLCNAAPHPPRIYEGFSRRRGLGGARLRRFEKKNPPGAGGAGEPGCFERVDDGRWGGFSGSLSSMGMISPCLPPSACPCFFF